MPVPPASTLTPDGARRWRAPKLPFWVRLGIALIVLATVGTLVAGLVRAGVIG